MVYFLTAKKLALAEISKAESGDAVLFYDAKEKVGIADIAAFLKKFPNTELIEASGRDEMLISFGMWLALHEEEKVVILDPSIPVPASAKDRVSVYKAAVRKTTTRRKTKAKTEVEAEAAPVAAAEEPAAKPAEPKAEKPAKPAFNFDPKNDVKEEPKVATEVEDVPSPVDDTKARLAGRGINFTPLSADSDAALKKK